MGKLANVIHEKMSNSIESVRTSKLETDFSTSGMEDHLIVDAHQTSTGVLGNKKVHSLLVVWVPH